MINETYPGYSFQLTNKAYKINIEILDERAFEIFEIDIIGKNGRIIYHNQGRDIRFYKVKKDIFNKDIKTIFIKAKYNRFR